MERTGLKSVACRKEARSDLVARERMALVAKEDVLGGALVVIEGTGVFGAKGMCHRPLLLR